MPNFNLLHLQSTIETKDCKLNINLECSKLKELALQKDAQQGLQLPHLAEMVDEFSQPP